MKPLKPFFKNLIQVGMVVKDLNIFMEKYLDIFKISPFYVIKFSEKNVNNMYINENQKNYSMKLGICNIGEIRFELIEPIGESLYLDYIKKYGEGVIHHIKLGVENYFKDLKYLNSIGIKSIQSGHQIGNSGKNIYNYLDSREKLGFICEIVHVTKDFIKPLPDYWYYGNNEKSIPIFRNPNHIGIVTNDISKRMKTYSSLFEIVNWELEKFDSSNVSDMTVYGKKIDYSAYIATCNLGNIKIKLIEPNNPSIFTSFLEKYGDGVIHHVGMQVDNYCKALKYLKSRGIEVIQSGNYLGKIKYSYLSTSKYLNFITEISEE